MTCGTSQRIRNLENRAKAQQFPCLFNNLTHFAKPQFFFAVTVI